MNTLVHNQLAQVGIEPSANRIDTPALPGALETPKVGETSFVDLLNGLIKDAKLGEKSLEGQIDKIKSGSLRDMLQLQRQMQAVHLKTELATKSAEAALSSVRRVQQMSTS